MLNKSVKGFDQSQKRQYDFSSLIQQAELPCYSGIIKFDSTQSQILLPFDNRSFMYITPSDLFLSINEQLVDAQNRKYSILPIDYSEYSRFTQKPYGYPSKRQAWRMITQRQTDFNGIGFDLKTGILLKNIYYKPLRIIIDTNDLIITDLSEDNQDHILLNNVDKVFTIEETSNLVNITMKVNITIKYNKPTDFIVPSTKFRSSFLINKQALKLWGGDKYIHPVTQKYYEGIWPEVTSISNSTIISCIAGTSSHGQEINTPVYEVIGRFTVNEDFINPIYNIRYVKKPKPIILDNLNDINEGLSIDGFDQKSECELPEEIHEEILQRAVELAKSAYMGDLNSEIALGSTSGTNMGIVSQGNNRQQ